MAGIFIGYRREDSAGYAGRLADILAARFGDDRVFRDLEDIRPGDDFAATIEAAVGACDALLIVIGPRWLEVTDKAGTARLSNPRDFVRIEIAAALRRGIRVIPVLVGGARMPKVEELPADIADLAGRHAHELSDSRWSYDIERLIELLVSVGAAKRIGEPVRASVSRPPARKAIASPRAWALILATTGVALFGVLNVARWSESQPQTDSGNGPDAASPAGLPAPDPPVGGTADTAAGPAVPVSAGPDGKDPVARPGVALRSNRILLSLQGAAAPDRATAKAALIQRLVATHYDVFDVDGSADRSDSPRVRALIAIARTRGAGSIVVGVLDTHAQPSIGRFFTGAASIALTVYSTSDGRILGSETVAIGTGGVPGKLATTAEAARTDASSAVGTLAAQLIARQLPARGGGTR